MLVWKVQVLRLYEVQEAELGTKVWEPFAIIEDEDGTTMVVVKALIDVETDPKTTEGGSRLGDNW